LIKSNINSIATKGKYIYASTVFGLFLSTNNGSSWTEINKGLPSSPTVETIAISGTSIYAATTEGVFKSTNNGNSWTAVNDTLTNSYIYSLAISGENIFAGTLGSGVWRLPLLQL